MKALIICDDINTITTFSTFLKSNNCEVIVYNWFLKALDNLDEIKPDLCIVNAEEFPRHWKIILQHLNGTYINKNIPLYIYTSNELKDSEKDKILNSKNVVLLNSLTEQELGKIFNIDSDIPVKEVLNVTQEETDYSEEEIDEVPTVSDIVEIFETEITKENTETVNNEAETVVEPVAEKSAAEEPADEEAFGSVDDIVDFGEEVETVVEPVAEESAVEEPADDEAFGSVDDIVDFGEEIETVVEPVAEAPAQDLSFLQTKEIILRSLINSPISKRIIPGKIIFNSFSDLKVVFKPDYSEDINQFKKDTEIKNAFYEYEKDCIQFQAKILEINTNDCTSVEMEFIE